MKRFRGFSKVGIIVGVLLVALVVGAVVLVANSGTNYSSYDAYAIIEGDSHNGGISDHLKTYADSDKYDADEAYEGEPVLIFEYADYQCPGCASMNPYINQAVEELKGRLVVVYRSYLLSYHQNATAAASAAEAAGLQGYWKKYADTLFTNQSEWEYASASERTELFEKYFVEVAGDKGDLEKFRSDMASKAVSDKISFDMGIGRHVGVAATPALFVDGQLIDASAKNGSKIEIDGKTFSWDSQLTMSGFVQILEDIVHAKLGEKTSLDK